MQLAEIVLTLKSCTLLSQHVSYGPISLQDRLEALGSDVRLPPGVHGILNTHLHKHILASAAGRQQETNGMNLCHIRLQISIKICNLS